MNNIYAVVGHLTPTDAEPDPEVQGKLDNSINIVFAKTRKEAETELLWYQDGIIVEMGVEDAQSA